MRHRDSGEGVRATLAIAFSARGIESAETAAILAVGVVVAIHLVTWKLYGRLLHAIHRAYRRERDAEKRAGDASLP